MTTPNDNAAQYEALENLLVENYGLDIKAIVTDFATIVENYSAHGDPAVELLWDAVKLLGFNPDGTPENVIKSFSGFD